MPMLQPFLPDEQTLAAAAGLESLILQEIRREDTLVEALLEKAKTGTPEYLQIVASWLNRHGFAAGRQPEAALYHILGINFRTGTGSNARLIQTDEGVKLHYVATYNEDTLLREFLYAELIEIPTTTLTVQEHRKWVRHPREQTVKNIMNLLTAAVKKDFRKTIGERPSREFGSFYDVTIGGYHELPRQVKGQFPKVNELLARYRLAR